MIEHESQSGPYDLSKEEQRRGESGSSGVVLQREVREGVVDGWQPRERCRIPNRLHPSVSEVLKIFMRVYFIETRSGCKVTIELDLGVK